MAIGTDPVSYRVHGVHYSLVAGSIARESLANSSVELFVDCAWRFYRVAREVTRLESIVDDAMFAHIYDEAPAVQFTPDDFRSEFDLVANLVAWILSVDPALAGEAKPTWKTVGLGILPQ